MIPDPRALQPLPSLRQLRCFLLAVKWGSIGRAGLEFLRDEKFRSPFRFLEAVRLIVAAGFLMFAALQLMTAQDALVLGSMEIPILVARGGIVLVIMLGTLTLLNRFDAVARRQDKAAFAAIDQKLAKAINISKLGSREQDLLSGEISRSNNMYTILGLNPDAHAASHAAFLECVQPNDRLSVEHALALALRYGGPYELRYRLARGDNSVRYI